MDFEEKVTNVEHLFDGKVIDLDRETVTLPNGKKYYFSKPSVTASGKLSATILAQLAHNSLKRSSVPTSGVIRRQRGKWSLSSNGAHL